MMIAVAVAIRNILPGGFVWSPGGN